MINDKLKLFRYYDYEFKRNFVLNDLNRILDKKMKEFTNDNLNSLSLSDKVKLIDKLSNIKEDNYFYEIHKDLHKCLEIIENRPIKINELYLTKRDQAFFAKNRTQYNIYPSISYDINGLIMKIGINHLMQDKNILLTYIDLFENKLVKKTNINRKTLKI